MYLIYIRTPVHTVCTALQINTPMQQVDALKKSDVLTRYFCVTVVDHTCVHMYVHVSSPPSLRILLMIHMYTYMLPAKKLWMCDHGQTNTRTHFNAWFNSILFM